MVTVGRVGPMLHHVRGGRGDRAHEGVPQGHGVRRAEGSDQCVSSAGMRHPSWDTCRYGQSTRVLDDMNEVTLYLNPNLETTVMLFLTIILSSIVA